MCVCVCVCVCIYIGAGAAGAAAMRLRVDAARSAFAREALGVSLRVLCVQDVGWRVLQVLRLLELLV